MGTGEPIDKAGAYALQGRGELLVAGVEGSVSNVIGLPLASLVELLAAAGLALAATLYGAASFTVLRLLPGRNLVE